jgi:hypothetical protein
LNLHYLYLLLIIDNLSSTGQSIHARDVYHKKSEKNLTAAIPPSIPYSDYLRRFKLSQLNTEYAFFHPYIPPSRPHFIPEKVGGTEKKTFYKRLTNVRYRIMKRKLDRSMKTQMMILMTISKTRQMTEIVLMIILTVLMLLVRAMKSSLLQL